MVAVRWSLAETVLNYQRISGSGWALAGGYVLLSGGAKLLATGRSDSEDDGSIARAAVRAAFIENLIELSVEFLRGKYLLRGGTTEELAKTLPILQASQQGEILTHLLYPFLVAQTLPSALLSTAATGALLHHLYAGVLSRYADTFRLFQPTAEDIRAVFKPEFVQYFEREVIHQPIGEWSRGLAASLASGQLQGALRESLLKFNVLSDVFVTDRAVALNFLLPYYSLFPHLRWQVVDEWALHALRSAVGFDDELIARMLELPGNVLWRMLGADPKEMHSLVREASAQLERDVANRLDRAAARLALVKLAAESSWKTTLLSLAVWATSSVLPMVLDKLFGWTGLANPVHHGISAGIEHIRERQRRREEREREERLRQEGWYGRHVGVGEYSVGTAAVIEAQGLPFERHSRYDRSANLMMAEWLYHPNYRDETAGLSRQWRVIQEGWFGRHVGVGELSRGTRAVIHAWGLPFKSRSGLDLRKLLASMLSRSSRTRRIAQVAALAVLLSQIHYPGVIGYLNLQDRLREQQRVAISLQQPAPSGAIEWTLYTMGHHSYRSAVEDMPARALALFSEPGWTRDPIAAKQRLDIISGYLGRPVRSWSQLTPEERLRLTNVIPMFGYHPADVHWSYLADIHQHVVVPAGKREFQVRSVDEIRRLLKTNVQYSQMYGMSAMARYMNRLYLEDPVTAVALTILKPTAVDLSAHGFGTYQAVLSGEGFIPSWMEASIPFPWNEPGLPMAFGLDVSYPTVARHELMHILSAASVYDIPTQLEEIIMDIGQIRAGMDITRLVGSSGGVPVYTKREPAFLGVLDRTLSGHSSPIGWRELLWYYTRGQVGLARSRTIAQYLQMHEDAGRFIRAPRQDTTAARLHLGRTVMASRLALALQRVGLMSLPEHTVRWYQFLGGGDLPEEYRRAAAYTIAYYRKHGISNPVRVLAWEMQQVGWLHNVSYREIEPLLRRELQAAGVFELAERIRPDVSPIGFHPVAVIRDFWTIDFHTAYVRNVTSFLTGPQRPNVFENALEARRVNTLLYQYYGPRPGITDEMLRIGSEPATRVEGSRVINEGWLDPNTGKRIHVGTGERARGLRQIIRWLRLPFKLRSQYDRSANLLFSSRVYASLSEGARNLSGGWVRSVLDLPDRAVRRDRWQLLRQAVRLYGTELEGVRAGLRRGYSELRSDLAHLISRAVLEPRRVSVADPYRRRSVPADPAPGDVLNPRRPAAPAPHRPPRLTVRYRSVSSSRYERERLVAKKLGLDRVDIRR